MAASLDEDRSSGADETDFAVRLVQTTPHAFFTPLIIAVNVGVFAVLAIAGVHVLKPAGDTLLAWGANFAPLTTGGQWWRLLTSTALHFGVVHLALNMWALSSAGRLVERLYGNVVFLTLYVASGLAGSLASVIWNQNVVSAGASGAVFGVYGALLAYAGTQRGSIPTSVVRSVATSTVLFVAYNLVTGFAHAGIDNAAHVGGLAGGLALGSVLARPLQPALRRTMDWRRLSRGTVAAGLVLLGVAYVARGAATVERQEQAFRAEVGRFVQVEAKINQDFRTIVQEVQSRKIDEALAADRVEPLVRRWADAHARLATVVLDPGAPSRERHRLLVRYVGLRRDSYQVLGVALRTQSRAKYEEFNAMRAAAEQTLQELERQSP